MIVFLTAFSDKEMIEYAVQSDAIAYLLKPYRDQEILATLLLAKAKHLVVDKSLQDDMTNEENKIELVEGYSYNNELKRLYFNKQEVLLGKKALELVQLLCKNSHITLEIDTILETLWETPKSAQTLRSPIHRIRIATTHNLIQNVNKFGYKIGLKL